MIGLFSLLTKLKKLAQLLATNQNTMAEQAKSFVQEKVASAVTQNPSLDQNTQQQIAQQATAEFQKETMKKIINEIQQ